MVSSGLFVLPGLAFALAGPAMFLAYLLAGFLAIPALLSKAELATAMPKAGGIYFYVDRSMGRAMGTLGGLAGWFSLTFKSAFALVGIGAFTALLFPGMSDMEVRLIAAAFCVVFTLVNLVSAHHAGRLQVYMVFALLAILVAYAVIGFGSMDTSRLTPFMPGGWGGLFATTGLVFVSFGGLTKAASVAEEVRDPGRDLPLGMLLAFGFVVVLYVVITLVTTTLVDGAALSGSLTPLNLGAASTVGTAGVIVISVAAILAFVSTANAGVMAASRVPLAMSRDRLLPRGLGKVHDKRGVPTAGILLTGGFMVAAVLFLELEALVKTASTLKLLLFVLVNIAVILMRESRIQSYRPAFTSPLYPWLQIFGVVAYIALISAMGTLPLALAGGFVVGSFIWYGVYARGGDVHAGDPAVIHIVNRIANRDLADRALGTELREILRVRDGIRDDRFDRLVERAAIVEVPGPASLQDFTARVANTIAHRCGMGADELATLLLDRERDTSTAISRDLAIPHAVIPGSGEFHLLVARCRHGVAFSDQARHVNAIFVLLGSKDERNFHLQCLMAIAQTAQESDFRRRWLRARDTEDLRELLLLSGRSRQDV